MYYLMVKKHNVTNLKYLCQTRRKEPYLYSGSGKYWLQHLEKHGYDISTEILGTFETKQSLQEAGKYYSELFNIVASDDWANLRIEDGDGGDSSKTPQYIAGMSSRRSYAGKENTNYGKVGAMSGRIGTMLNKIWCNNGCEEHLCDVKPSGWVAGRLKVVCEHCNIKTSSMNYKRWHGGKCKKVEEMRYGQNNL